MKPIVTSHLIAFSIALAFIAPAASIATADNADGTQSARLIVGNAAPDYNSLPTFLFSGGELKPVAKVTKDRHRFIVFCDSDGEDLAVDVSELTKRITALKFPDIQLYVVIPATPDELSVAVAKQISLTGKAFDKILPDARLIAADREMIRKAFLIQVGKLFPGVDLNLLLQDPDDQPVTQAILISKEGVIEWAGDIAWADRPMEQLVAGNWDRSVTEMACRLSEALFFDMKFHADVSKAEFRTHYNISLDYPFWVTRLRGPYVDTMRPTLVSRRVNYSKPLLGCIEAEAKGQRDEALQLLAESTLAVTCRLLSMDQYWNRRSAVSFLKGLQTTLAANTMVSAEVSDSDLKARLEFHRQSLGRWVAILRATEAGDLQTVDTLIAGLPEAEVKDNEIGILRCRIDTCLASSRPEAVNSLQQVLAFVGTFKGFDRSDFRSGTVRGYILTLARKRLSEAKPISDEMREFLLDLKNSRSFQAGQSRRRADTLIRDGK